ncbi:hypothetical protein PQR52_01585 [Paraburkholderia aspalathi]
MNEAEIAEQAARRQANLDELTLQQAEQRREKRRYLSENFWWET